MQRCPICENKLFNHRILPARDGYYYQICKHCSGGILMPRNKALKGLKTAYRSDYFDWQEALGFRKYLNKIQLFQAYPEWIQTFKTRGILLDVGAGIPDFVLNMKKRGWKVEAQEISAGQVKIIQKYLGTSPVHRGDFEKINLPSNHYDVITFWHMLEHLGEPAKAVRKSARLLKKDGMLFAEFPNFDSFNLHIFGTQYIHFDLPGHLVYYNKKSLKQLFLENGFTNITVSYPLKLNGSFSLNLFHYLHKKTKMFSISMLMFYISLPISILLAGINSFLGKTDLMRVSAIKRS